MLVTEGLKGVRPVPDRARGQEGEGQCTQDHHEDLGNSRAEEHPANDGALLGVARYVARVVVAALGPTKSREREDEGESRRVELPSTEEALVTGATVLDVVDGEHHEDRTEGNDQGSKDLHHRGVAEIRHDRLNRGGEDDEDDLEATRHVHTRHLGEHDRGPDDEDQSLGLESQLGDPVKETDQSRTSGAEGGAAYRKGRCSRLGSLQRGETEQEER